MNDRLDGLMKALRMLAREPDAPNRLPAAWLAIDQYLPPLGVTHRSRILGIDWGSRH